MVPARHDSRGRRRSRRRHRRAAGSRWRRGTRCSSDPTTGCSRRSWAQRRGAPSSSRETAFRGATVSPTFHGRDVFAPAAAHVARGLSPARLGPRVTDPVLLAWPRPRVAGSRIGGAVVHVDRFGNLVTSIPGDALALARIEPDRSGRRAEPPSRADLRGARPWTRGSPRRLSQSSGDRGERGERRRCAGRPARDVGRRQSGFEAAGGEAGVVSALLPAGLSAGLSAGLFGRLVGRLFRFSRLLARL